MVASQERPEINTLIVVCCHAIYLSGPGGVANEANWLIEPFQAGETPTFTKHAAEGVEILAESRGQAILCFSGGATKRGKIAELISRGELSEGREWVTENTTEAESYERVALESELFGYGKVGGGDDDASMETLRMRIFQENFATDSYQNILLALLQYSAWVEEYESKSGSLSKSNDSGVYPLNHDVHRGDASRYRLGFPKKLIIVSHEFKRARFMNLHLPAIISLLKGSEFENEGGGDIAEMRVEYIGINPPFDEQKMKEIEEGDRKRGYGVWEGDLHGVGDLLSKKRIDRGWDADNFITEAKNWYGEDAGKKIENVISAKTST